MGSAWPGNAQGGPPSLCRGPGLLVKKAGGWGSRIGPSGPLLRVCVIFPSLGPRERCVAPPCQPPAPGHQEPGPLAPAKAGPAPQGRPSQVCGTVLSSLPAPTDGRAESPSITAVSGQLPSLCPRQMAPLLPPSPSPSIYHPCQAAGWSHLLSESCVQNKEGGRAERHVERHPSSPRASSLLCTACRGCQPSRACVYRCVCVPVRAHVHAKHHPICPLASVGLVFTRKDVILPLTDGGSACLCPGFGSREQR